MRTGRATLAILLALAMPLNAETTADPLWYLLSTHILARDEKAVAAPGSGGGDPAALASLQADLRLLADGFESFRDEGQVRETLIRLEPRIAPELRPFFKSRASSLEAIYRTLAVTDYTWAIRFPEPPCSPAEARRKLLDSRDGLFQNETGTASRWLVAILGAQAEGKSAEQALDRASFKAAPTAAEYERRRALARRLTLALTSEKAAGAARSKLYCARAAVFEDLSSFHRPAMTTATLASRSIQSSPEPSVFIVISNSRRAAATLLQTKSGIVLLTDAAIVRDTNHPKLFAFSDKTKPIELTATVTRRDADLGLAVLTYSENVSRPALTLSGKPPSKDDLVSAIGHAEVSGLWTKSSGLVTKAGPETFQTDAVVAADFSGGPILNDAGDATALLVSRPADTEEGRWPIAITAESINDWLAGAAPAAAPAEEIIEDAGTAAILNRTRPSALTETGLGEMYVPGLPPPPPEPPSVCVSNCADPTPRRSYTNYTNPHTSYSGSSYSGSGNAELGEALGKLGAVLIMEGIPALFRGISKLFKGSGKPKAPKPQSQPIAAKPQPAPIVPEKVKEPPTLTWLTLEALPASAAPGGIVTLTARANLSDPEASKSGILVAFKASPASLLQFDGKPEAKTDAAGTATISATLRLDHGVRMVKTGDTKAVKGKTDRAQSDLDAEVRAMSEESSKSTDSNVERSANETIELEARATVRNSKTATTSVVLSNAPKPECNFEPINIPDTVGDEPFTVQMKLFCPKLDGSDIKLDGHEITLNIGDEPSVTLYTDADGYAAAVFQAHPEGEPALTRPLEPPSDAKYIEAANSGAVAERVEKTLQNPRVRKLIVVGNSRRVPLAVRIAVDVAVGVVVAHSAYNGYVDYNGGKNQEKYQKGTAAQKKAREDECTLKPGEDVIDKFVDRSRLAAGFLNAHEGLGHTKAEHINKDAKYLRYRIKTEGKRDASTFYDQPSAERIIKAAIAKDQQAITSWFLDSTATDDHPSEYVGSPDQPIGISISFQNLDSVLPKYDARVFVRKIPKCRIVIITSFPE